jgi:hypothetical protein
MAANPRDMAKFKQDVSALTAPKNRLAQPRMTIEDYLPTNNPPKPREERKYEIEDLEFDNRFQLEELNQMKSAARREQLALQ